MLLAIANTTFTEPTRLRPKAGGCRGVASEWAGVYIGHVDSRDVTGMTGRVVTPITPPDPGEVVIAVGGGSETFTARARTDPRFRRTPAVEEHFPPRHVVVIT